MKEVCEENQENNLKDAMMEESILNKSREKHLQKLKDFKVFRSVPRSEATSKPLSCRWVDTHNGLELKSRLTVHGFKQNVSRTEDFYSETPNHQSLRLMLTIAARDNLTVAVGDSASAFLQAPLHEETYNV